jgi:hypothetical protein
MRSDPENPITFFGREIRANFIEGGDFRPQSRKDSNSNAKYYDLLLKKKNAAHEALAQQTEDASIGWASRPHRSKGTESPSESDIKESH